MLAVHAFAEEMNKSRRMCALQARALAEQGHAVLQIDLLGCGDSSGDFDEATWEAWIDDVQAGAAWLAERHDAPLVLWGHRAGCLLAAAAGRRLEQPTDAVFWQPTPRGSAFVRHFLRARTAAALIGSATAGGDGASDSEVAGYVLSDALLPALGAAELDPWPGLRQAHWFELSQRPDAELLPATRAALERWRGHGVDCRAEVVAGPAFWQTTEIECAPALIAATREALQA